jgi:hypothetical protein
MSNVETRPRIGIRIQERFELNDIRTYNIVIKKRESLRVISLMHEFDLIDYALG